MSVAVKMKHEGNIKMHEIVIIFLKESAMKVNRLEK